MPRHFTLWRQIPNLLSRPSIGLKNDAKSLIPSTYIYIYIYIYNYLCIYIYSIYIYIYIYIFIYISKNQKRAIVPSENYHEPRSTTGPGPRTTRWRRHHHTRFDVVLDLDVLLDIKLTMKKHISRSRAFVSTTCGVWSKADGYSVQRLQLDWFLHLYLAG